MIDSVDGLQRPALDQRHNTALGQSCLVQWDRQTEPSLDICSAAFELSVAGGMFPLLGHIVSGAGHEQGMPASMISAAAVGGRSLGTTIMRRVIEVEETLVDISASQQIEAIVSLLRQRLEFQAALISLGQSLKECRDADEDRFNAAAELSTLECLVHRMDEAIYDRADTFCLVSETRWPAACSEMIAWKSWQPRPWWLTEESDHRLERLRSEVAQISQHADEMMFVFQQTSTTTPANLPSDQQDHGSDERVRGPEFALAADDAAELDDALLFVGKAHNGAVELEFSVSLAAKYAGRGIDFLPDSCPCRLHLTVTQQSSEKDEESRESIERQIWRIRFGGVIKDITVDRQSDIELKGSDTGCTAGELRRARHEGDWSKLVARRRG